MQKEAVKVNQQIMERTKEIELKNAVIEKLQKQV